MSCTHLKASSLVGLYTLTSCILQVSLSEQMRKPAATVSPAVSFQFQNVIHTSWHSIHPVQTSSVIRNATISPSKYI